MSEFLPQVEVTYNVTRMGDKDSDDGVHEAIIAGVISAVVIVMAVVVLGIYRDTERCTTGKGLTELKVKQIFLFDTSVIEKVTATLQ